MTHQASLNHLQHALREGGLRGGLEWLNKRVAYRYTVVYRFDGDAFFSVAVIDKLREPPPALFAKVPFDDSFCQYSVGNGEFKTADSMNDRRLDGHVHQADVQSYVGLPLMKPAGGLFGTFCHLDLVPRKITDAEFEFLQEATGLLSNYLPVEEALVSR